MERMRLLLVAAGVAALVGNPQRLNVRHSPDGRWLLYQTNPGGAGSIGVDGMPLWVRRASEGTPVLVEPRVLGWPDFVQSCGNGFVVSAGGDRYVSARKHIDVVRPPAWRPVNISHDAGYSWFSATCSPDGKWIAATRTVNREEGRFDSAERSVWLLAADGSTRRLLAGTPGVSDEAPHWSSDGRYVTYYEHATHVKARVRIYNVDVRTGRRFGPLATQQDGLGYYGHQTFRTLPLVGKTIAVDPGHNGANWAHPAEINRLVAAGGFRKACDTTGTSTNDGYSEAAYTFDVATRLARILRRAGARVVLTRTSNDGVGPCIDERAAIGNRAHADAAVSIHADGGPSAGRGFDVIYKPDAPDSRRLALAVRQAFAVITDEPYSSYIGSDGLQIRTDLGGLNLSVVPKVLVETANMRNADDARRLESAAYRERVAVALARGLESFLS
jgi:N-acetylmuramoyl-L-alanine amidase